VFAVLVEDDGELLTLMLCFVGTKDSAKDRGELKVWRPTEDHAVG
jgi:hypothetical protein